MAQGLHVHGLYEIQTDSGARKHDQGLAIKRLLAGRPGEDGCVIEQTPYRELPADETCRLIDATLSRYRDSDRRIKNRLIMAVVISLIFGFIGGHYWKGMVTNGTTTEVSKPKVGKPGEHVKGYRP